MFLDLMELDADLDSAHQALVAQVRRFVDEKVLPVIGQHHVDATVPKELFEPLSKLGILSAKASGELDPLAYGLAMRELERGSSTVRSLASVQGSLVIGAIARFGSEAQKANWLAPLGELSKMGCFGLTEPDFGSNPSGMRTRAEKTTSGYKITGTKMWITNGTLADVAVIWAKFEDGIRGFLVETDRKGFKAEPIADKWSFRSSDTAQLFLESVEIPAENILPGSKSLGSALKCLNEARYGICWGVIGAAIACFEEARAYVLGRPQFRDQPLAKHQLIQSKLAWMATDIVSMQLMAKRLGELKDKHSLKPEQVSMVKMHNCRKALDIARTCRDLLGAAGIDNGFAVGRHLVDLETVVTYEGTEHIHALILGNHLTGIPAFE